MIDEESLVAAICQRRAAYEQTKVIGLEIDSLSEAGAAVYRGAAEQYGRDPDIKSIDSAALHAQIVRRFGDGDMARSVMGYVAAFPKDTSAINVVEEYRLLQLAKLSTTLATLLATGKHGEETTDLLRQYAALRSGESDSGATTYRLGLEDFSAKSGERIGIMPKGLNDYIGGGALRGHNITVYGRPDSGKSMFALNQAAYLVKHGYKVLYVANEEPAQDITRRLLSRLTMTDIAELHSLDNLELALDRIGKSYENWFLFHKAGCSIQDIALQASKIKPDCVIVDQLKNVAIKEDNRALQLDKLARQVRELGIEYECLTISVTQAGESAQNKLILSMSDIEWSNTGIPGAADLMIGIGLDEHYQDQNKRMISLPKNKINGRHGAFPCWIDPQRTMFSSKRRA